MRSQLLHWWQHNRRFIIIGLLLIGSLFIVGGYVFHWSWTGFVAQPSPPNTQPTKSLWDWMSLLIIPIILALVGLFFTRSERKNEQALADQRTKNEQAISRDNQQEAALQGYLDRMSELLLHEKLRESKPDDEVRKVARVRTLTMLYQLNTRRTNYMLAFLRESGLATPDTNTSIVAFSMADLDNVDLQEVNLSAFDFSGAHLNKANLTSANLIGANLTGADLNKANLSGAILREANLYQAHLYHAHLSDADLVGADLKEANLSGADLVGADLREATFREADLREANLREAILIHTDFHEANLSGAVVYKSSLDHTYFTKDQIATLKVIPR